MGRSGTSAGYAAVVLCLGLLTSALLSTSCDRAPVSKPLANHAPSVRIVRGEIVDHDTLTQVSQIDWIGWDDDGEVVKYQYAIDVPDSFDAAELAAPSTPGLDWNVTEATSGRFAFTTAIPETVLNGDGSMSVSNRFIGDHSFHVRSVDDQGAVSRPDRIQFTVTNLTPHTTITTPKAAMYVSVADQIFISWTGKDPDKPSPDLQPVAYEYKLIPLASVFSSTDPQYAVDVAPGPLYQWTRISGGVNSMRLNLVPPQSYWFVIRAIDYLGAVENHFETGVNAFKLESSNRTYDRPILTVREATRGTHIFPDDGLTQDLRIYTDQCLKFEFSADLSLYGGILLGYNVGIDVADVEDWSPTSGFMGWTTIPRTGTICFRYPGFHTVTILCRDTGGGITNARYDVTVIGVPVKDREVLFVDDYSLRGVGSAIDRSMDDKAHQMLEAAGFADQDIYTLEPWGPDDSYGTFKAPTREEIGRYRLIVWNVEGAGSAGTPRSALIYTSTCSPDKLLLTHINSGGALWIYGDHVVAGTKAGTGVTSCVGDMSNDAYQGTNMLPNDFTCKFMSICNGDFRNARTETAKRDGMVAALPTEVARAELMPRLEADSTTFQYAILGGLRYVDAAFGPIVGSEDLETLYTMSSVKNNSYFNGKPVAWRWVDDDPVPEHGALALFMFSMHEVKQGSAADRTGARGLALAMADWFRQHMVPPGSP